MAEETRGADAGVGGGGGGTPGGDGSGPLPEFTRAYFEYVVRLLSLLDPGGGPVPVVGRTWNGLFTLELAVIERLPGQDLAREAPLMRERLRNILGDREYTATIGSIPPVAGPPGTAAEDADLLKEELRFLVRQVYRRYALTGAREAERNRILRRVGIIAIGWIGILLIGLVALIAIRPFRGDDRAIGGPPTSDSKQAEAASKASERDDRGRGSTPTTDWNSAAVLLVISMILGSVGAYLSLLTRLEALPYSGDPLFRMLSLAEGRLPIDATPVIGSVLAAAGTWLFSANLIQGQVFPEFGTNLALDPTIRGQEFAKLVLWSFIIGFAERYVPDALDRIIKSRRDQIVQSSQTVAAPSAPTATDGATNPSP